MHASANASDCSKHVYKQSVFESPSSLNPMALPKTKVSYSLDQPKIKEKKSFREGESETELATPRSQPNKDSEERLAKRRVRNRAKRAAQTVEQS